MARDRLAAIRAQQHANEANQRLERSVPQQRVNDPYSREYEPQDFDPRTAGAGVAPHGRRSYEQNNRSLEPRHDRPQYTSNYQVDARNRLTSYEDAFYEPSTPDPRIRRLDSAVPLVASDVSPRGSGNQAPVQRQSGWNQDYVANVGGLPYRASTYDDSLSSPREDFNPNLHVAQQRHHGQSSQLPGVREEPQTRRHEPEPLPRAAVGPQQSQYTPVDPVRTRQRSISGDRRQHDRRHEAEETAPMPQVPPSARQSQQAPRNVQPVLRSQGLVEEYDEKTDAYPGSEPRGPIIKAGDVPFEEMGEFFTEVSDLQQALRDVQNSVQAIRSLHTRMLSLPSHDSPQAVGISDDLHSTSEDTRLAFNEVKDRIHQLAQGNANLRALIPVGQSIYNLGLQDVDVREAQVEALKLRFKDAVQAYAEVERDYRARNRARMERQVRVVNPSLSPDEVEGIVRKAESGGSESIFQQALLRTGRSYAAKSALREVESRAAELARIEATLIELAQLFNDMSLMVEAQDVQIVAIEKQAAEVNQDMEKGLEHTKAAVVSARNARKWRWICFSIILVIIIVVVIVVVVEVVIPATKKNNNNNNPPPPPRTTATPAPAVTRASDVVALVSTVLATGAPYSNLATALPISSST